MIQIRYIPGLGKVVNIAININPGIPDRYNISKRNHVHAPYVMEQGIAIQLYILLIMEQQHQRMSGAKFVKLIRVLIPTNYVLRAGA